MSTQYTTPLAEPQSRGTSVPHLVMGLVFLGIAGSWVLHEVGVIESVQVQWLMPLILVVAGAAGLLASLTRGITRSPRRPTENPSAGPDEETLITEERPTETP